MASLKYAETRCLANYSKVTKKLVVYSRGKDKREVLREIVRTLYVNATRAHQPHMSEAQIARLDERLAALFRTIEAPAEQERPSERSHSSSSAHGNRT